MGARRSNGWYAIDKLNVLDILKCTHLVNYLFAHELNAED